MMSVHTQLEKVEWKLSSYLAFIVDNVDKIYRRQGPVYILHVVNRHCNRVDWRHWMVICRERVPSAIGPAQHFEVGCKSK